MCSFGSEVNLFMIRQGTSGIGKHLGRTTNKQLITTRITLDADHRQITIAFPDISAEKKTTGQWTQGRFGEQEELLPTWFSVASRPQRP